MYLSTNDNLENEYLLLEEFSWEEIADEVPISPQEFFWNEERSFHKILQALQKHSGSLRKLNLAHVTFNGCSEGARILHAFKEIHFPHLEALSL